MRKRKPSLSTTQIIMLSFLALIAVDTDGKIVNAAADELPICKCADVTDPDVIRRDDVVSVDIDPHAALEQGDRLIVIADTEKLARLK